MPDLEPKHRSVQGLHAGGFHKIAYTQWGNAHNKTAAVCLHGLTRNGRDFDHLAQVLADDYRVICPDMAGRGSSDWLADPGAYSYPQYLNDSTVVLGRVAAEVVDWIGTSMGGLIGMLMAATPNNQIRKLVMNDVGPFIPKAALVRIAQYVGLAPTFHDLDEAEAYMREVSAPFGPLTDDQWRHLAVHGTVTDEIGQLHMRYDPAIGEAFRAEPQEDVDLWAVWDQVKCPVLVVRGAKSDLLSAETVQEMKTRHGNVTEIVLPETGHAPMMMDDPTAHAVRDWLKG